MEEQLLEKVCQVCKEEGTVKPEDENELVRVATPDGRNLHYMCKTHWLEQERFIAQVCEDML